MSRHNLNLSHPKYRPDIDGLRALAVLSVVGFHAFPGWVKGGFIGVDVFFVISGFLISGIIFENLDKGTFTFREFYARRIVRIFPALILVMAASYAFGWFSLLDDEYRQMGKHIAGGAAFVSNLLLWQEAGYFDNAADTKPLLHLWSLGIEEQFYLVWPLLLWLAWKRKLSFFALTLSIAIVSFYINVKGVKQDADAAFYSPPTRFWELMCGGLLAWIMTYRQASFERLKDNAEKLFARTVRAEGKPVAVGGALANLSSLTGLAFLAFGLEQITKDVGFPGMWAVIPVLAAVLIIAAGPHAWVNRGLLSNRIAVWLGLISFPLYLWHWPLLSFARIVERESPGSGFRMAAVILSIVLAWLTYRLAERPLRFGRQGRAKVAWLVGLMAIMGGIGYYTFLQDGMTFRQVSKMNPALSSTFVGGAYAGGDGNHMMGECGVRDDAVKHLFAFCVADKRGNARFALMGDSKASALYPGLVRTSDEGGRWLFIGGTNARGTVVPLLASDHDPDHPLTVYATEAIARNKGIDTVVLVTAIRALFSLSDGVHGRDLASYDHTYLNKLGATKRFDAVFDGLNRVVTEFADSGKKIVLVVDNPALPSPQDCVNRRTSLNFFNRMFADALKINQDCYLPIDVFNEEIKLYRDLLAKVQHAHPGSVEIFDPTEIYCDKMTGICGPTRNGRVMYSFTDHISDYAAGLVGRRLNDFLENKRPE